MHHFDFFARERYGEIEDWLHVDGKTLLSEHGGAIEVKPASGDRAAEERVPVEDDDLTDAEREMLGAT